MHAPIPEHSCVDCGTRACYKGGEFPPFCVTQQLSDQQLQSAKDEYHANQDLLAMMRVATPLADECMKKKWPRVKATIEFCHRMGYARLGICTCIGYVAESRQLAKALRQEGFEVYGVSCKLGQAMGSDMGFCSACNDSMTCNPLVQAHLLNKADTDLNIIVGLCIGHDIVFTQHSDAPVTTFMTKDPAMKQSYHLAFDTPYSD